MHGDEDMGIFLSINSASSQPSSTQKLYHYSSSDNNKIIIDPTDFPAFVKIFRDVQCKKEDNQIELHNLVLEWKSKLGLKKETKEIRNKAYGLIETIEEQHDEQDAMMDRENMKLDALSKGTMMDKMGNERKKWDASEDADVEEFDEMESEITKRRQYLEMFNKYSTDVLKHALINIEACQKMVEFSTDFKENESESELSAEEDDVYGV